MRIEATAHARLASVVINNYNYERYLAEAIESALAQSYVPTEVVVVDDGSTDGSREVIARFGDRVVPVLKTNGGQASALNAGYAASRGELVVFLDADDVLLPRAVERAMELSTQPELAKVHWPLWEIDADGRRTGPVWPREELPEGDLRHLVIRDGPSSSGSPPTSGNAWTRRFLDTVLPIPTRYTLCADDYLYALAPAMGRVARVAEPQGLYRIHGRNNHQARDFEDRVRFGVAVQEEQCTLLAQVLESQHTHVDPSAWLPGLWYPRLARALDELRSHVPAGATFILVDDDVWGAPASLAGRRRLPFPEHDGQYWGPPADDAAAIAELERLRALGAAYLVIAWPSFWWMEHYAAFHAHLLSTARLVSSSDVLTIFDLGGRR